MSYTGKLKFILLLSYFEVDNFTANIDKDVSMLFSQCRNNADEHIMFTQFIFSNERQL